jgi:HTH-type transcriptional regulator/antitoxin HigA
MATATTTAIGDAYFRLVREFPLVPIRSDAHLRRAHRVIDALLSRKLDSGEEQYLAVLSDLVADYEDTHHPIPASSNAQLLAHLLEAHGITQASLSRATGIPRSTLSEILHGKRTVSKRMIPKLSAYFHVEPAVWLS